MTTTASLDVNDPKSIRAYCLSLATLTAGLHADMALVLDAAERFEQFIVTESPVERGKLHRSGPLQPLLSPEVRERFEQARPQSEPHVDQSYHSPVSGVATETVAEPPARAIRAGGKGESP